MKRGIRPGGRPSRASGHGPIPALLWLGAGLMLASLLPVPPATAQAWVQEAGSSYVKLSRQRSAASEQYRSDATVGPYAAGLEGDGYRDHSTYLYAEHGLTSRQTLVLLLPYKDVLVRTPHPQASSGLPGTDRPIERSSTGLQNAYLGVRWGLTSAVGLSDQGAHRVALNVGMRVPLGYDRSGTPSIGSGQIDLESMIHYGVSLWPFPGYAQAGLGFRARTGLFGLSRSGQPSTGGGPAGSGADPDFGNEWLVHLEAGLSLGRWVLLQGLLFGTVSNQPPELAFDPENPVPTRQRYVKPGIGVTVYPIQRIGLSVQVFGTPWGANTVRSTDWFFGVESRF